MSVIFPTWKIFSPEKTHIGNSIEFGGGFEFLGYRFEGGYRYVRSKSLKKFKDKVRMKTHRTRGDSIERIISGLNPDEETTGWRDVRENRTHGSEGGENYVFLRPLATQNNIIRRTLHDWYPFLWGLYSSLSAK